MTEAERRLVEARRLRNAARGVFDAQRNLVKQDLTASTIGKRIANRLADDGRAIVDAGSEAAKAHPPLVAGVVLAVTGWLLRKPLVALASGLFVSSSEDNESEDNDTPEPSVPAFPPDEAASGKLRGRR